ncbi:MAG TPA: nitrous oxide reductase accessory protein NosL [Tepidisphaeraceae bacterium]|nr:nitrous oxide reductase accessory protein NosL [Tepidisphaeraceae bacterium]
MRRLLAWLALTVVTACGCSPQPADGPPRVRYGSDECVHCGMILSEERHAAAMRVTDADGTVRDLLFDDIGDMIAYQRAHPELKVIRRYVHDYQTLQWLDALQAYYLLSEQFHTPMGSGIVAFGEESAARALAAEKGISQQILSFAALTSAVASGPTTGRGLPVHPD